MDEHNDTPALSDDQIEYGAMIVQAALEQEGAVSVMAWSRTPDAVKAIYRRVVRDVWDAVHEDDIAHFLSVMAEVGK